MAKIETENVTYSAGGTELQGHLATPAEPNGAGVIVVHEWWGLNDYIRGRAAQLAELGYTALAADMYGGGATADNPDDANKLMSAALGDVPAMEARFQAAFDLLAARDAVQNDKIAAIGYCFGGAVVLHAARIGKPLAGVVSFHGSLGSFHEPEPGTVEAKILVLHGAADELVPQKDVEALREELDAAEADYEIKAYEGALHGYTNPQATENGKKFGMPLAYDEKADQQSWEDMKKFFQSIF